jgi:2-methylcitrate dehydratase PrpD
VKETETLARYVSNTAVANIPEPTRHQAKRLIIDQLGCQVGNSDLPWSRMIFRTVQELGSEGPSTVVATGAHFRCDDAAFVNASFGAANEIDDADTRVRTHPGAVIVPAAMAVAEQVGGVSGEDLILSTVLGYEVMIRVAGAGFPVLLEYRHHHTPVAAGPFGAAAVAARLLSLDVESTLHALAIAASHCGGLMEYTRSGGSVKRIHTGIAAQAGVRSAIFAKNGLTGPRAALEGDRGFLAAFADRDHVDRLVDRLGEQYMIDGVAMKKYFAMYRIHAPLEAIEMIMTTHGIGFDQIATVEVGTSSWTVNAVGTIVEPADALGAQFSLRFALALAARYGSQMLQNLTQELLADRDVVELARRIDVVVDPEIDARKATSYGAAISLTTRDGHRYLASVPTPKGAPENPLSDKDVEEKFLALSVPVIGSTAAHKILSAVWEIETVDLHTDLFPHLAAARDVAASPAANIL